MLTNRAFNPIVRSSKRLVITRSHQQKIQINTSSQHQLPAEKLSAKSLGRFDRRPYYVNDYHELNEVYTASGSLLAMPKWYRFGLAKVIANIVFFIGVGAFISKKAVHFLEENDIFKPEGDDDDDEDD